MGPVQVPVRSGRRGEAVAPEATAVVDGAGVVLAGETVVHPQENTIHMMTRSVNAIFIERLFTTGYDKLNGFVAIRHRPSRECICRPKSTPKQAGNQSLKRSR